MTFREDSRQKLTRLDGHAYVGACEARPAARLHSQRAQDQQGRSAPRRACLHTAPYSGARGHRSSGRFGRPTSSAATGDEGVVVIPAAMAEEVADEAFEQTVFEDFVEERVRAGKGIFGLYPPEAEAEQAFREWRREKGR
ncbi:hypothetical protein J2T08_002299 [Neorhizobium galegae]|uniref:hypothetical protein n=1 Tax=Neorhizobium galegae TaxID=399 RepID=UPI00277D1AF5|nr:hypothetical protein [Neorhizobium galegae]MDQ0134381.1 hypothetical protein [Neorhizobium galegae]